MESEELLLFAADSARIMLENGGETYRAEEIAMGIIASQGGAEPECFATNTGLMLSFTGEDGKVRSIVRRIKRRRMNLEKVSRLDRMANEMIADRMSFDEASDEMDAIERMRERPAGIKVAASAMGAGFFTLLFGGRVIDAVAAAAIGSVVALMLLGFQRKRLPEFLASLTGGALAALASLAVHYAGFDINTDVTIIGVIMLLVPGVAITNAIRDIIAGDLLAGIARAADAFLTAAAISSGAGSAVALWRFFLPGVAR
ncbi:MAG: threonine/serine exporter family protein [Spirochaetaceae bacterium]|nr:threonine/serine exporter family protein [Spirochaetaceae bacterium]